MIYLDNAAGTPVFPEISQKYHQLLEHFYANPSANHSAGFLSKKHVQVCEEQFLGVLGINDSDVCVIWTSGGTESNNLAITGYSRKYSTGRPFSVVSTPVEHASVFSPVRRLEQQGMAVSWANIEPSGLIELDHLSDILNENTHLVSVCLVQNETGVIQNLEGIREIMDRQAPRAKLHVDASQAVAKMELPWKSARIDMLTLSSHKVHGPPGMGALIVRHFGDYLHPLIEGGGQQRNLRSGTLNTPGITAFLLAVKTWERLQEDLWRKTTALNRKLRRALKSLTDKKGNNVSVHINSPEAASPYILNFSLSDYQGAVIMRMLGEQDIIVGTGSACATEAATPSRVLKALGLTDSYAYGAIRVSFGFQNQAEEIDGLISKLQLVLRDY